MRDLYELATDPAFREDPSELGQIHLRLLGLALVGEFVAGGEGMGPPLHPAIAKVRGHIRRAYAMPLDLGDLAKAGGVSRQHLLRVYRRAGAGSPLDELWACRLETARELLQQTGLSVEAVADRCGFSNPFHFSRKFRRRFGISPRSYRQRVWMADSAYEMRIGIRT
jgi:transcriptional regulator GlxA family with amidase domain